MRLCDYVNVKWIVNIETADMILSQLRLNDQTRFFISNVPDSICFSSLKLSLIWLAIIIALKTRRLWQVPSRLSGIKE